MKSKYFSQPQDTCCFVYAVINAAVDDGVDVLDYMVGYSKLISKCSSGPTLDHQAVLDSMGLKMKKVSSSKLVLSKGGILTIMHPIYNLHSMYCKPLKDDTVLLVNSWLGPLEHHIDIETVITYLPPPQINHWVRI